MGNARSRSRRQSCDDVDTNRRKSKKEDGAAHKAGECEEACSTASAALAVDERQDRLTHNLEDGSPTPESSDNCSDCSVATHPTQCRFQVFLHCTNATESVKERTVCLERYPSTGRALKLAIERQLSVPACVQTLRFNTQLIRNSTRLKRLRVQDGDTFILHYPAEADVDYLSDIIDTLTRILAVLRVAMDSLTQNKWIDGATHSDLARECDGFSPDNIFLLIKSFSTVVLTGIPNANLLYFIDRGGLKLLLEIYSLLHCLQWHQLPYELQQLEYSCLQIIWKFSATLGIRRLVLRPDIINQVFQSLMRTSIHRNEQICLPGMLADTGVLPERSRYMLAEAMYAALVVVGK